MANYSTLTTSIRQETKAREATLPLRNQACRSQFFLQPQPTQKVCLFFHGFTAAPYQFVPLGQALFRAGYNVLIPLMPGHGQAGNWNRNSPPPLPTDPQVYQQFALEWLEQAQALGTEVIVGGLSGGGTMSAWLALERPQQIYRALVFAAYLSSSSKVVDLFVRSLHSYFEWTIRPGLEPMGYTGFLVPALKVFLEMGQDILHRAENKPTAPMFIVSSESDRAVGNNDHRALFEDALKRQPKTWYQRFDRVLDIPHTMMIQAEGNQYQNLLNVMAKAYIQSNLTWAEVQEIGYRMTQGKTFPAVVNELNLSHQVSADMPAMMTMVDKRSIVQARNPSLRGRF
jgi:carboxylesterase